MRDYTESYFHDPEWKYYHSIAIDSSKIWHSGNLDTIEQERYFYDLMLDSIREKKKIEEIYNL
tara:strand:- start:5251 stop:5439 length:189 start_codon:yes stop_codon:yes gene_type:complete